ncbi:MAG: UvrB/UvrC motif-containing protein, partial [Phycisphaerae bacterium]|nr:UvrB/UvrC motif-containing protein [Phycisphaerae bacterium]
QYRQHGVLGCGDCYEAFSSTLAVVLDRAHGGATQHVGKAPAKVGDALQRAAVLQQLLRDLEEAVRAEQYERAARLRDQVKEMRPGAGATTTADALPAPHSRGSAS